MFIAVEGMDGAGKSTQIELLCQRLINLKKRFIVTREPGGTPIGDQIREILLSPKSRDMSPRTEALLYAASRAQHIDQKINPALAEGKIVITDRYVLSSYVYQGIARGLGVDIIKQINDFAIQGRTPDLTIFLFVSKEKAIERKKAQKELDRLEAEGMEFHNKVNQGFYELADEYKHPKIIINTDKEFEAVHEQIWQEVQKYIDNK